MILLESESTQLDTTLFRKFISLLVSVWYFENEFTAVHWVGTSLVFGGTLVFSEVHRKTAKCMRE